MVRRGALAIAAIAYSFLAPEERRHTVTLNVSIGVLVEDTGAKHAYKPSMAR
jgi:hypothetical protein